MNSPSLPQLDVLETSGLRLEICRLGAELVSIRKKLPDGTSVPFLYRDGLLEKPATGWANHATVMGYFIHRLWREQSIYKGRTIRGGNHGFLRHFVFDEPRRDAGNCALNYHVPAERIPADAYPLRVSCTITYQILAGDLLEVRFGFENHEPEEVAHLSFGLHPGFAISGMQQMQFLMPPGTYLRLIAPGNFLNGESVRIHHDGGPMPFAKEELPASVLLDLAGVPERNFELLDPSSGRSIGFHLNGCPYLTLWSDGPDFLCVEPCWGMPDSNPPVPFEQKVGIQTIPPGGTLTAAFRMNFDIQPTGQRP